MPVQKESQSLVVRPIKPEEAQQWNQLVNEHRGLSRFAGHN
ncbi:MAG: hypothetical protein DDT21_02444 [Syntrophomonadaceae bacterium]|nr:hypothetical protein [Bacillota bacterium]